MKIGFVEKIRMNRHIIAMALVHNINTYMAIICFALMLSFLYLVNNNLLFSKPPKTPSITPLYFLRKVLECCENEPLILVDGGPWYRWALQRLRLRYNHQTFGERNAIEQWYSLFKARVKRFWKRFPYHSSLESIKTWTMAWCAIYNLCWR